MFLLELGSLDPFPRPKGGLSVALLRVDLALVGFLILMPIFSFSVVAIVDLDTTPIGLELLLGIFWQSGHIHANLCI